MTTKMQDGILGWISNKKVHLWKNLVKSMLYSFIPRRISYFDKYFMVILW